MLSGVEISVQGQCDTSHTIYIGVPGCKNVQKQQNILVEQ